MHVPRWHVSLIWVALLFLVPAKTAAMVAKKRRYWQMHAKHFWAQYFLIRALILPENFVVREWTPLLDNDAGGLRDPKSALQEWAQGQGAGLPQYEILSRAGPDHAPEFVVEVIIDGIAPASGTGASKRRAEQAAAAAVIKREKISNGG